MAKLLENTFRAVNISLANEIADVSTGLGLDVMEVIQAAATKPYGFMPFYPGPGVGGHCIPCDPHYLLWQLRARRLDAPLIDQAMRGIAGRPRQVVRRAGEILAASGRTLAGARVRLVGVTYKPDVEDVRESPALQILQELLEAGADVEFVDPLIEQVRLPSGGLLRRREDCGGEAVDLVIVHTAHSGFDLAGACEGSPVLDTTYRMDSTPRTLTL
jgi:nucleotide sugar dehydrogenase